MIKSYVVRAGDHLAKIAHNVGLDPDIVWKHPKNKDLRAKRPDGNLLCEGDILFLPLEDAKGLPLQIGAENRFSAEIPKIETHLRFKDAKGPFAGEAYVIEGLDEPIEGTTDGDGGLVLVSPVTARVAKVFFTKRARRFAVLLGDMDPITEVSGIQLRLTALGFFQGVANGTLDDGTAKALANSQETNGLPRTGKVDAATIDALKTAYGC